MSATAPPSPRAPGGVPATAPEPCVGSRLPTAGWSGRSIPPGAFLAPARMFELVETLGVRGRIDVVGPHDDGILPGHRVVVLADAGWDEPEPAVQGLRRFVVGRHLEREAGDAGEEEGADAVDDEGAGHAGPLVRGGHG